MPLGEPTRFRRIDLPDSNRFGFAITLPDATANTIPLEDFTTLKTRWRDMPQVMNAEEVRGCLTEYLYSRSMGSGGYRTFYFIPELKDSERETPFKIIPTTTPHTWDAVLSKLAFAEDTTLPQNARRDGSVVEVPAIVTQMRWTDQLQQNARATIRLFLSHRPWTSDELFFETPVPTAVYWTHQGQQIGSLPSCLHPEVRPVIDTYSGFLNPIFGAGTSNSGIADGSGFDLNERIPATNFGDWEDQIIDDRQEEQESGMWVRTQVEIHAPEYRATRRRTLR